MMEAAGQPFVTNSGVSVSKHNTVGRGRGRARNRTQQQPGNLSSPGLSSNVNSSDSHRSVGSRGTHSSSHDVDSFEDAVVNLSVSDRKNAGSGIHYSANNNGQTSDKENSPSPRTQRSRKSVFDSKIMSRINSHLQQSIGGRSEVGTTRSLDRQRKESSPASSHRAGSGSPVQHQESSLSKFKGPIPRSLLIEGRPRSMTDPTPSSPHSETKVDTEGCEAADPGIVTSTPLHPCVSPLLQSPGSVTSSSTKARGRGRGRGRARGKRLEMEVTPLPGTTPISHLDHVPPGSVPDASDKDKFADAEGNSSTQDPSDQCLVKEVSSQSSTASENPVPSSPTQASVISQAASAGSQGPKRDLFNGAGRGLSLKIDVGEKSPNAENPEMYSPLADDITLLLSPNHEYTLDWAAAMATPTPDTSSDSAPDWNVSGVAEGP